MKLISAFIEIDFKAVYIFLGLVVLLLLLLLYINLFLFMKGLKKKNVRKVKVPAKPSKYLNGLAIVAGSGTMAERLIHKLSAENKRVINVSDKCPSLPNKSVTFIESDFNGNVLESVGFTEATHDITLYCVYEDDYKNLNTALKLSGALENRLPACGERKVKVSYKNIAKTQFYNNLNDCISYFNTDELTAKSFVQQYNLKDYLPKPDGNDNESDGKTDFSGCEAVQNADGAEINGSVVAHNSGGMINNSEADMDSGELALAKDTVACEVIELSYGAGKLTEIKDISTKPFSIKTAIENTNINESKEMSASAKADKPFSVQRIFVGFSQLNSEILEKLVFTENLCENSLNAVVFDKNADTLLPAFYNRTNDVLDIEYIRDKSVLHPSKMIALKIDAEAFELYDKIKSLCQKEDFCAIYIDIGNSVMNTETALELRDTLIKNGVAKKAVIFCYNESEDFIKGCSALNKGFEKHEHIVFYGAADCLD